MGLGFSIDTPIKVAHYGIDSVISIVDDNLIEKMRKVHSNKSGYPYEPITAKAEDRRAERITAYLNLVNKIVNNNFSNLKKTFGEKGGEFEKYIDLLPDNSELKLKYNEAAGNHELHTIKDWALSKISPGSIDVNIMTKVDKANYEKDEKLPVEFNDAHAALRGYANSNLKSSIVLSAGMNPRLYSYFENFDDFYPDENGELNKKIILKVSDYRSALIQGKYLAKKGLWVSEYRIESGLNCGGHAFATEGFLMGPILEEFKKNRESLKNITHEIYTEALCIKNKPYNGTPHDLSITAQGGVGTNREQNFLLDHFDVDSVGWGTPFLLVPETTNVDDHTLLQLSGAKEEDLFLSRISPLGVPFNSLRGATKDVEKFENASKGKPGSPCPKKFLQSNTEFSEQPICTASSSYQSKKIKELKAEDLSADEFNAEYNKITEKACLCVGLATAALKKNDAANKIDGDGVLICPGPNLAYFSSIVSLKEMVSHINGRVNLIRRNDRPNMFVKEIKLYLSYLNEELDRITGTPSPKQTKYFTGFQNNLMDGINYYKQLFAPAHDNIISIEGNIINELTEQENELLSIKQKMIALGILQVTHNDFSNVIEAVN